MNKENAIKLWKIIQEAGDYLKGQLPDHPNHPKGRNPYAHVAICVKSKFQKSYKDIEDEKFKDVVDYIEFLKKILVKSNKTSISFSIQTIIHKSKSNNATSNYSISRWNFIYTHKRHPYPKNSS